MTSSKKTDAWKIPSPMKNPWEEDKNKENQKNENELMIEFHDEVVDRRITTLILSFSSVCFIKHYNIYISDQLTKKEKENKNKKVHSPNETKNWSCSIVWFYITTTTIARCCSLVWLKFMCYVQIEKCSSFFSRLSIPGCDFDRIEFTKKLKNIIVIGNVVTFIH